MSLNSIGGSRCAELDYWIAACFQGRGVGTEAARLAIDHVRDELRLKVLFGGCLDANPASGRILEKNAFLEVGHFFNDGMFWQKFLKQEMRRFRKDLVPGAEGIRDFHPD